ncbi:MAG: hypothetical protein DRP74_07690 [Candidatus Omnitrophota bacterium]|nr:MAG: hypothetical protein DRP74_07690 [Candidatus Omnitrophota bacterium]
MNRIGMAITKIKTDKAGMTFTEVLIAALIVLPVIIGVMQIHSYSGFLSEINKGRGLAMNALSTMIEKIQCTPMPYSNLSIYFPDGVIDGPAGYPYDDIVGGYSLNEEHITVTYTNILADPLEIIVTISWQDMKGRVFSQSLSTMKAG